MDALPRHVVEVENVTTSRFSCKDLDTFFNIFFYSISSIYLYYGTLNKPIDSNNGLENETVVFIGKRSIIILVKPAHDNPF